jgi:general secretion pathway protein K
MLGLLVAGLAASARSNTGLASNVRGSATAEAAADGAVQQALFQLLRRGWQPDGSLHRLTLGNTTVAVTVEDQTNRFNPNFSSPPLLAALLGAVGLEPAQATDLSRMLVDWRTAATISLTGGLKLDRYRFANLPYGPPDRPFESIDEMGLVPGMSAELLARLRPYLSVYQAGDASDTANALLSRSVAADAMMLGRHSALVGYESPDRLVLIRAIAEVGGGTRFIRRAVIRIPAQPNPGDRVWQLLTWD